MVLFPTGPGGVPPPAVSVPQVKPGLMWKLDLKPRTLSYLDYLAYKISPQTTDTHLDPSQVKKGPQDIERDKRILNLRQRVLRAKAIAKNPNLAPPANKALEEIGTHKNFRDLRNELNDVLVGLDPPDVAALKSKLDEIEGAYVKRDSSTDSDTTYMLNNDLDKQLKELGEMVGNAIEKLYAKQQSDPYNSNSFVKLLIGYRQKSTLESAYKTSATFSKIAREMRNDVRLAKANRKRNTQLSEAQRKRTYANIKLLKADSKELYRMQRVRTRFLTSPIATIRLRHTYKKLEKMADDFERHLNFSADEILRFRSLTPDAHRPVRQHLLTFAYDHIQAGMNLGTQARVDLHKQLMRDLGYTDAMINSTKLPLTKEWGSKFERYLQTLPPLEQNRLFTIYTAAQEKDKAITTYLHKLQFQTLVVLDDKRLGAGNPHAMLSEDKKAFKKQVKEGHKGVEANLDFVQKSLIELQTQLGLPINEKKAKLDIREARDAILNARERWEVPIQRNISLPAGELHHRTAPVIQHRMTAMNAGQPSSAFRGRKASDAPIQSNFHQVEVEDREGEIDATYLSSATPVEFFQEDDVERMKATKLQTMELLANGALMQIMQGGVENGDGTKGLPYQIDFNAVALLSPETLRQWVMSNPRLHHAISKIKHFDISNLERRMLFETQQAFMALQRGEADQTITIKGKGGDILVKKQGVPVNVAEPGKPVKMAQVYSLTTGSPPKEVFVQFDISFFDFGVNDVKKLMLKFNSGNLLEDGMNAAAWENLQPKAQDKIKRLRVEGEAQFYRLSSAEQSQANKLLGLNKAIEVSRDEFLKEARKLTGSRITGNTKLQPLLKKWSEAKDAYAKELNNVKNARQTSPEFKKYARHIQRVFDAQSLMDEVSDQFEFKEYKDIKFFKSNPYSMAAAVIALGTVLKFPGWTGCRSGKDRTSLVRVEVGARLAMRKIRGRFQHFAELDADPLTKEVREGVLLKSGHIDDMAIRNVGSKGLNLEGHTGSLYKRDLENAKGVSKAFVR